MLGRLSTRWRTAPATPEDLLPLAGLMASSPLLRRYGATLRGATAALRRAYAAGDTLLVAWSPDGALAGVAWLILTRVLDEGAYLRLLVLAEEHQGQGLGSALLRAAQVVARRGRARHLYLLVTVDNSRARHFYESHGFRHVGDLPGLVRPGLDEALYHKRLTPSRGPRSRGML